MATTATTLTMAEDLAGPPDDGLQYELVKGVPQRMSLASFGRSNVAMRIGIRVGA